MIGLGLGLSLGVAGKPKGGIGMTSGQRATLVLLRDLAVAAQSNNPDLNGVYETTTPTVTVSAAADAALSNEYLYTNHSDKITFGGVQPVKSDGSQLNANNWAVRGATASPDNSDLLNLGFSSNTWSSYSATIEFETNAPTFEARTFPLGAQGTGIEIPIRCVVDGKYLNKTGHGLFASNVWYKVAGLPDGPWKCIKIEGRMGFYSVRVAPGYAIRAVTTPSIRGVVEGDSYSEGQSIRFGGSIKPNGHLSWGLNAVRQLGWGICRQVAIGLTGYYNIGGSRRAIPTRVPVYINYEQLTYILNAAGFNDGTSFAPTYAGAISTWQQQRAAQPNALIVVMGVWPSANPSAKSPIETNIKAAFDAWADPFSIFIPVVNEPGKKYEAAAIDVDGVHWSNSGHATGGALAAGDIRAAVIAKAATLGL